MSKKTFVAAFMMLLTVVIIVPSALFLAPRRASATSGTSCVGGLLGAAYGYITSATDVPATSKSGNTINASTAGSTFGSCVYEVILVPLARAAIRVLLQSMTRSVINFINGTTTGRPSFVQDLSFHLQQLGDVVAVSLINQIGQAALKSPFGTAIAIALKVNYLRNTSMAGFLAANMSTLFRYSPNVNRFLAGDWAQGGAAAWFALTTQPNNNPYAVFLAAQGQLGSNVNQAQGNRRQDLIQSSGFLSFCGTVDNAATGALGSACENGGQCSGALVCINKVCSNDNLGSSSTGASSTGVNPGDSCTNADGTPGQVKTPGSVVHDYTQKAVVASGFDQLISAQDIDNSLGMIMNALLVNALSGTGIFGSSPDAPPGNGRNLDTQLKNYTADSQNLAGSLADTAQTKMTQIRTYMTAWDTIHASAEAASTSVLALIQSCTDKRNTASSTMQSASTTDQSLVDIVNSTTAQINAAQFVLTKKIAPVFAQAQKALVAATTTAALAAKVAASTSSGISSTSPNKITSDMQSLVSAPPSVGDVQSAQSDALISCNAAASPPNSLTNISGGSIVDRMNLISANADAIKAAGCTVPTDVPKCVVPPITSTGTSGSPETDPTKKTYNSWDADFWLGSVGSLLNTDDLTSNAALNFSQNPTLNPVPNVISW